MILVIFLLCVTAIRVSSINRPVYKVVLNQKGYAQFLQYDIETPPLREFTFCTWFRIYDLFGDQSIFSYIANSNNRVVRLWLDSGGRKMKLSIDGRVTSSSVVDIRKDVWRHVCLSYQSDHGAWALYLDARLVTCEVAQSLQGYVLPEGGSVIVGYGTDDNGAQNGLEGEIFGANMLLVSTIEKNYTLRNDPHYKQRTFKRNKVKGESENVKYVVLRDLQTGELKHNFEMAQLPEAKNSTKNFIKFRTPHSFIEHDVGVHLTMKTTPISILRSSEEKEILDFPSSYPSQTFSTSKLWNFDQYSHTGIFKQPRKVSNDLASSTVSQDLVMLAEYETPPPVPSQSYLKTTFDAQQPSKSIYKLSIEPTEPGKSLGSKLKNELPEYETPPPVDKNTKVYGQWTSSKFAGTVLNHLKNIQFHSKEQKKIPPTIPLRKLSDTFPYASDFKFTKLRPPPQFQRKKIVERRFDNLKRSPQTNLQILEDDLRNNILKSHAQNHLKHVEITNRGVARHLAHHRFYRNVDSQELDKIGSTESTFKPKPFSTKKKHKERSDFDLHTNNLRSILPFLKSLEYFTEDSQATESSEFNTNKMYTKTLSSGNKWHNVKSYSNDYTPRKFSVNPEDGNSGYEEKIADHTNKHPTVLLKYKHEHRKVIPTEDESILKGRVLATTVSNHSDYSKDSISILKYNHGFLPGHKVTPSVKNTDNFKNNVYPHPRDVKSRKEHNFNKLVKIGNALNEQHVIGINDEQKKRSFIGGNDDIPDIHRYRSDIDNMFNIDVPPSLQPRICKNVEMYDRVLYIQPDESIDMTHILSPVKAKNPGIEFVIQNYKKCSLEESNLRGNEMLFIDWSKTPVRLFGGAYPMRTTDLCGFF